MTTDCPCAPAAEESYLDVITNWFSGAGGAALDGAASVGGAVAATASGLSLSTISSLAFPLLALGLIAFLALRRRHVTNVTYNRTVHTRTRRRPTYGPRA